MNRKIILLTLSLFFVNIYCFSFQNKSGLISTAETWSDTIHVVGDISITQNGSVTIAPGTYIEFQGLFSINIDQNGKISAIGNVSSPISFVSQNTLSFWNGINFDAMSETADSSKFEFCTFKYSTGAISIIGFNKVQVNHCLFSNNKADISNSSNNGGGINCLASVITINSSIFKDNYAARGGGLSFKNSTAIINDTRITGNTIYFGGAGIYCEGSVLNLNNCSIDSNYHSNSGGGAGIESTSTFLTLTNCRVINNKNNGIYSFSSIGKIKIINSIIANNEGTAGGGINCYGISVTIINSTIVNNKTAGGQGSTAGGIFLNSCPNSIISNSIIWNNYGFYNDFYFKNCTPVIQNCNIKDGNTFNLPNSQYINNISLDPKFNNPSTQIGFSTVLVPTDWSLSSCSPCIDKGDKNLFDTIPLTDINQNGRVFNDTVDIGAYEYQGLQTALGGTKIIFVKVNGNGDGTSWANAKGSIQDAINQPIDCFENIEVWVASGTYLPDTTGLTDKRKASFRLRDNVKIYGGFVGTENTLSSRNWKLNPTILSGNIGAANSYTDNSYHVVYIENVGSTAVLDGFTISDGLANVNFDYRDGAGIYCSYGSPILNNLMVNNNIAANYGSGIYINYANPTISNSTIYNNIGNNNGNGLYLFYSNAIISNSQIMNNYSQSGYYGGGLYLFKSNPIIVNTIIAHNENNSTSEGGGLYCYNSSPKIINSIIANNKCSSNSKGAGLYCKANSKPEIYNSIIYNNRNNDGNNQLGFFSNVSDTSSIVVISSLVQGGNSFSTPNSQYQNNFDFLPRFVHPSNIVGVDQNALNSDWSLQPCSPCINIGDNQLYPNNQNYDMALNNRFFNSTIDVGPFEYQGNPSVISPKAIVYVKPGGSGDGSSWADAIGNLQKAIDLQIGCYQYAEIWVAAGTYCPDTTGLENIKDATFNIRNNVKLYGGFNGTETDINQRNWVLNQTVLDGNIGSFIDSTDNSNNVISVLFQDSMVVIDGFTLKNGHSISYTQGGGAVYCKNSHFHLMNSVISKNSSEYKAGGIYAIGSNLTVENSKIINNKCEEIGAIYLESTTMDLINCQISNNYGDNGTGGVRLQKIKGNIENCLISNNTGDYAGAIHSTQSNYSITNATLVNNLYPETINTALDTLFISNSILWDSGFNSYENKIIYSNGDLLKIKNSNIQNGDNLNIPTGNYINNISENPNFEMPIYINGIDDMNTDVDWSLKSCSPCVNAGFFDPVYNTASTDLNGNSRIFNQDTIDMGAYEYQGEKKCLTITFVITNGANPGIGFNVILNGSSLQEQLTDNTGKTIFYNNSKGDKFRYDISLNFSLIVTDSILNLTNDTIIYIQANGISESTNLSEYAIYPNPATDKIYIETTNAPYEMKIIIYDINGKELLNQSLNGKLNQINMCNFPKGIYFVKLINDTIVETHKIVKG